MSAPATRPTAAVRVPGDAQPGTDADEKRPKDFHTVFRDELGILRKNFRPPTTNLDQLLQAVDELDPPLTALCLSGGGIRSAAFALGVLQTLTAKGTPQNLQWPRKAVCEKPSALSWFDYFSTVSGGGYIGGFVSALRHHLNDDPDEIRQALARAATPAARESSEILGLRGNSNYLTPRLGLFSPDVWTVAALYVRNIILLWSVFLPFFMALVATPMVCRDILKVLSPQSPLAPVSPAFLAPLAIAALALWFGLQNASFGRRYATGQDLTEPRFAKLVLLPIMFAGAAITLAACMANGFAQQLTCHWAIGGGAIYGLAWLAGSARLRGKDLPHVKSEHWFADLVVWLFSGALFGAVLKAGFTHLFLIPAALATFGVSWTLLAIFAAELVFVALRSLDVRGDMDREWLARAAGWLAVTAGCWTGLSAITLYATAQLEDWHHHVALVAGLLPAGSLSTGALAAKIAGSARTAATDAEATASSVPWTWLVNLVAILFGFFLIVSLAVLHQWIGRAAPGWADWIANGLNCLRTALPSGTYRAVAGTASIAVLIVVSWALSHFVNINRFSLHALYRNRLMRTFLGSARLGADPPQRKPDPFTGFDSADSPRMAQLSRNAPLHIVNVALNEVSSNNLSWQERKAVSFTLSPLHAGSPTTRYLDMQHFGGQPLGKAKAECGLSLATAMAISGAAVSPNMGYHSSPLLGFLLMLFNARLGCWLGNPSKPDLADKDGPNFALKTMIGELLNRTTSQYDWIYLSDGGHFDNLGLYEMLRRRCRFILVCDAGCDPEAKLSDLGDAVRKASIDFGVKITFANLVVQPCERPTKGGDNYWTGSIEYPGTKQRGTLIYLRPTYTGTEPPDIRAYAEGNKAFPHDSTAEQWFGERQFEAYRALGALEAETLWDKVLSNLAVNFQLPGTDPKPA